MLKPAEQSPLGALLLAMPARALAHASIHEALVDKILAVQMAQIPLP